MIQQDLGRPFDAKQSLQEALNRNPKSQNVQKMLARLDAARHTAAAQGCHER